MLEFQEGFSLLDVLLARRETMGWSYLGNVLFLFCERISLLSFFLMGKDQHVLLSPEGEEMNSV